MRQGTSVESSAKLQLAGALSGLVSAAQLALVELTIDRAAFQQLFVLSLADNLAALHDDDFVG